MAAYSLVMSLVVMVAGKAILGFFGVEVDDFRIAGGIVLLTIALGMLGGPGSIAHSGTPSEQQHQSEHASTSDVSSSPRAFPTMVGPGSITTLIVLTRSADGARGYVAVAAAVVVVVLALLLVLWFAPAIGHHMS